MSYYYRQRGRVFGPYDEEKIRALVGKGVIGRTSDLSSDGVTWDAAEKFDFLYPKSKTPPASSRDGADTGQTTTLQSPPGQATQGPPFPGQSPLSDTVDDPWFYSVDGKASLGPEPESRIIAMLQGGLLNERSVLWQEGRVPQSPRSLPRFSAYCPPGGATGFSRHLSHPVFTIGGALLLGGFFLIVALLLSRPGAASRRAEPPSTPYPDPVTAGSDVKPVDQLVAEVEASVAFIEIQHGKRRGNLRRKAFS